MATMKEIGLGITTVLQASPAPEPLYVDLWNEHPDDAAELIRAGLAECHDGDIPLKLVRVPTAVWELLSPISAGIVRPLSARVEADASLGARLEFWRKEPT
jgi:hypothetical protein